MVASKRSLASLASDAWTLSTRLSVSVASGSRYVTRNARLRWPSGNLIAAVQVEQPDRLGQPLDALAKRIGDLARAELIADEHGDVPRHRWELRQAARLRRAELLGQGVERRDVELRIDHPADEPQVVADVGVHLSDETDRARCERHDRRPLRMQEARHLAGRELGRLTEHAVDDRLDDALPVVQIERLLAADPTRALARQHYREHGVFSGEHVVTWVKRSRKLEEPDFGRAVTLRARRRSREPRQQRSAHDRALFGERVRERDGIGGHARLAEVVQRQKPVIYGFIEARCDGCVTHRIDELEEARSARLGRVNAGNRGRDLFVAADARDLFDEVDLAFEVRPPARRFGGDRIVALLDDAASKRLEDAEALVLRHRRAKQLRGSCGTQTNRLRLVRRGDAIDGRRRSGSATELCDEGCSARENSRDGFGIDTTLEAVARVGVQAETPRRAANRPRVEVRALDEDVLRLVSDLGVKTAHDAGHGDWAIAVTDQEVVGGEGTFDAIERRHLLALGRAANDDFGSAEPREVEAVNRMAPLEQNQIGRVDDVRQGAKAEIVQSVAEPEWRWSDFDTRHERGAVPRAAIAIGDLD